MSEEAERRCKETTAEICRDEHEGSPNFLAFYCRLPKSNNKNKSWGREKYYMSVIQSMVWFDKVPLCVRVFVCMCVCVHVLCVCVSV